MKHAPIGIANRPAEYFFDVVKRNVSRAYGNMHLGWVENFVIGDLGKKNKREVRHSLCRRSM